MSNNHFKLYPYSEATSNSLVLNKNEVDYYIWLELPHGISNCWNLYEVVKCGNSSVSVDFTEKVYRECCRPWIRIESSILDLSSGLHMYKFSFVDSVTTDTTSMYFAYHIQDDNPDRSSYIYMKRDEVEPDEINIRM